MPIIASINSQLKAHNQVVDRRDQDYFHSLNTTIFLQEELAKLKKPTSHAPQFARINDLLESLAKLHQFIIEQDARLQKALNDDSNADVSKKQELLKRAFAGRDDLIVQIKKLHLEILQSELNAADPTRLGVKEQQQEIDRLSGDTIELRSYNLDYLIQKIYQLKAPIVVSASIAKSTSETIASPINEVAVLRNRVGMIRALLHQVAEEQKNKKSAPLVNPYPKDPELTQLFSQKEKLAQDMKNLLELESILVSAAKQTHDPKAVEAWEKQVRRLEALYDKEQPKLLQKIQARIRLLGERGVTAGKTADETLKKTMINFMEELDILEKTRIHQHRNRDALRDPSNKLDNQINAIITLLKNESFNKISETDKRQLVSSLIAYRQGRGEAHQFKQLITAAWNNEPLNQNILVEVHILATNLKSHNAKSLIELTVLYEEDAKIVRKLDDALTAAKDLQQETLQSHHIYTDANIKSVKEHVCALEYLQQKYKAASQALFEDLSPAGVIRIKEYQHTLVQSLEAAERDSFKSKFAENVRLVRTDKGRYEGALKDIRLIVEEEIKVSNQTLKKIPGTSRVRLDATSAVELLQKLSEKKLPLTEYQAAAEAIIQGLRKQVDTQVKQYMNERFRDLAQRLDNLYNNIKLQPMASYNPYAEKFERAARQADALHQTITTTFEKFSQVKTLDEFKKLDAVFSEYRGYPRGLILEAEDSKRDLDEIQRFGNLFDGHGNTEIFRANEIFLKNLEVKFAEIFIQQGAIIIDDQGVEFNIKQGIPADVAQYLARCDKKEIDSLTVQDPSLGALATIYQKFNECHEAYKSTVRSCTDPDKFEETCDAAQPGFQDALEKQIGEVEKMFDKRGIWAWIRDKLDNIKEAVGLKVTKNVSLEGILKGEIAKHIGVGLSIFRLKDPSSPNTGKEHPTKTNPITGSGHG